MEGWPGIKLVWKFVPA